MTLRPVVLRVVEHRRGRRIVPLLCLLAALTACGGRAGSSGDVCEEGTIGPCNDTNELQTFFPER